MLLKALVGAALASYGSSRGLLGDGMRGRADAMQMLTKVLGAAFVLRLVNVLHPGARHHKR